MKNVLLFLITTCLAFNSRTQTRDQPIEVKTLSINIKAGNFIATTQLDIEFYNPNNKVLDGEFNFSLKPEQVVTGFALDINNFLREGVIVDKQKARVAYENTIRRRIDPGILEMTRDNNFRVRVYPMPANGTRKVRIFISQILAIENDALQYSLPFDSLSVQDLSIQANIINSGSAPIARSGLGRKEFHLEKDSFLVSNAVRNIILREPIAFSIPIRSDKICTSINGASGQFMLRVKPLMPDIKTNNYKSVTVFWDVSGSGESRRVKKEIEFLDRFLKEKNTTSLQILTFSSQIINKRSFNAKDGLTGVAKRFLENLEYDGGTNYDQLKCAQYDSDVFILFSDGISNYGNSSIETNAKPVYCVNSSPTASHDNLIRLANKTTGRYFDLQSFSVEQAIAKLQTSQLNLIAIESKEKINLAGVRLPLLFDQWITVAGSYSAKESTLNLKYGSSNAPVSITLNLAQTTLCDQNEVQLAMVLQQYRAMQLSKDEEALIRFARENKIVSAGSSFIVLDRIEDYIEHDIEPPSDLSEEYNKRLWVIQKKKAERKAAEENALISNLERSVALYNDRIRWWKKDAASIVLLRNTEGEKAKIISSGTEVVSNNNQVPDNMNVHVGNNSLSEVVVVGYGIQRRMDLTGATSMVSGSQLQGGAFGINVLSGRVAGVSIAPNNPGLGSKISIRGMASTGLRGDPLFVVDGIFVSSEQLSSIPTNNIQTVEVFKDAQAAAIYGSRASNGAIVITTRTNYRNYGSNSRPKVDKYEDLDDVSYVTELKDGSKFEMYNRYRQLKPIYKEDPAFFIDAAQLMMESGDQVTALRILTNLLEVENENHQMLRTIGYTLETWKMYKEAIQVYKTVLAIKEEEPQSYRDLALAYERNGQYQEGVDLLYTALTKNWYQYEERYRGMKSIFLNEMNAIINRYQTVLNLSSIRPEIIRPLPVDLRIVIDWNKDETDIDLHIEEPDGENCDYGNKYTKSGGRLSDDFTQGYGPEEYQIKEMKKGRYAIRVDYYGDRYQKVQVPSVIKLTVYRNFGRPNQTMTIQTLVMDHQTGMIEIGEIEK